MKILVSALAARVAGGRAVALNFLRCYRQGDFPHELVVQVPAGCGYEELAGDQIRVHPAPAWVHRAAARPWVDNVWMRRVLEAERPAVVFAMGNFAYPAKVPQLVLFHWPYAIYSEPELWKRMSLRERASRRTRLWLFGRRARFASHFAAQTETARARLADVWGLENVSVIPNAVSVGAVPSGVPPRCLPSARLPAGRRALLCLTRYYPHKNLEVLLSLGRRIRETGAPYCVLLTLSPDEAPAARALLRRIDEERLGDVLVNLGSVPMEEVPDLHAACAGLLLPTLLESFSGTYVESMHYGRPVFTSDRDFARDVCGDVAYYFDPHSADDILGVIRGAFENEREMERRVLAGRARCERLPDWPEVTRRYVRLLEAVAAGRGA